MAAVDENEPNLPAVAAAFALMDRLTLCNRVGDLDDALATDGARDLCRVKLDCEWCEAMEPDRCSLPSLTEDGREAAVESRRVGGGDASSFQGAIEDVSLMSLLSLRFLPLNREGREGLLPNTDVDDGSGIALKWRKELIGLCTKPC